MSTKPKNIDIEEVTAMTHLLYEVKPIKEITAMTHLSDEDDAIDWGSDKGPLSGLLDD